MAGKKEKLMFVDKAEMYKQVCLYKSRCERAKHYGAPRPAVPESLAADIFAIAESISKRPNFIGYPFREDMLMDGVEHVLKYLHTFNTEKFNNVFGWCYKIIWQCYGNRIKAEKKHLYIKFKQGADFLHELTYEVDGGSRMSASISGVDTQFVNDFIEEFEEKNGIKPRKKK